MIHRIYSSLPTFKNLDFHPGLNVLLAEKSEGASNRQTRNRAGKSSLIEIVHFLTGSNIDKKSLFKAKELSEIKFGMDFDLAGQPVNIERQNKNRVGFVFNERELATSDWREKLGQKMFGLSDEINEGRAPTFRSIFAYFVRRAKNGAFLSPEKHAAMQGSGDYQMALMYLFGLDWQIARDWQNVRDQEKTIKELKKATKSGAFGSVIGSAAELRTQLTVAEDRLMRYKREVEQFRVHPLYLDMEEEANDLTRRLADLSNENTIDLASIRDLESAMESEAPPELMDLQSVYQEAGIALPNLVNKRYEDVRRFHESVVRNRKDYLTSELYASKSRIQTRNQEKVGLDGRRSEIMGTLKSYGALDQFTRLQAEVGRLESQVEMLRQRFESAEKLEGTKSELEIERNRLLQRLRRDFTEQRERLSEAILAYEQTSEKLYEDAGSMLVDETANGPTFRFEIQGARSEGIKNMQVFCFDMMLMRLCAKRGIGPGFLIHDSHLFDGVDGRQVVRALRVGAENAKELGFQYIVTMNEDDAFKETEEGFNLNDYILDVKLTDATEDGGLFGIRFD
ncbi:MAG: ABC-three component system protein [Pseudomonadota bacterium]